jgi:beta-lactamase regulating signal transducer with metallopeptidase domain
VWAALATLLALRFLVAKILLQVRIGRRALVRDPHLLEIVDLLREEAGLSRLIRLTRAEGLASPVALGLSEICIPDAALTDLDREQQESMLAHELAHLVRRDPLWLVGICLLESVFFFQPLLRVARRRIQEAAEYQCDDWAVRRSGSDSRSPAAS